MRKSELDTLVLQWGGHICKVDADSSSIEDSTTFKSVLFEDSIVDTHLFKFLNKYAVDGAYMKLITAICTKDNEVDIVSKYVLPLFDSVIDMLDTLPDIDIMRNLDNSNPIDIKRTSYLRVMVAVGFEEYALTELLSCIHPEEYQMGVYYTIMETMIMSIMDYVGGIDVHLQAVQMSQLKYEQYVASTYKDIFTRARAWATSFNTRTVVSIIYLYMCNTAFECKAAMEAAAVNAKDSIKLYTKIKRIFGKSIK